MKVLSLFLFLMLTLICSHNLSAQAIQTQTPDTSRQNIYLVHFPKGKQRVNVGAYMLGLAHPVTFIVKVKHGKTLNASIRELSDKGNIRINQIIMPDGSSDGPFSKTVKYPIQHKGTYKIIAGGSNMQGDDWKGAFNMRISIQ
ncbi:hypothetical protein [Mucilaginibacter paludis]|uniref:YtkA-like domain-containing protein n=1 Tax=Mucilaginibacter paludis DSM 18603 TaxID=714943 RepID=H1Y100_9SPHI|nr:hypothetical protein [Mucilaginibacter paludis]EHQ29225.1 hypothetical protein Mucpa_5150 [Mucilaginibacter paludis DSM 18603]